MSKGWALLKSICMLIVTTIEVKTFSIFSFYRLELQNTLALKDVQQVMTPINALLDR